MSDMYGLKLSKYYDVIHKDKDYITECELILKNSNSKNSLLDIGCGTANHSIILSKYFNKVVGIDLSEEMIDEAKRKILKFNIDNLFLNKSSLKDENNKFDTVISMFNVVNHIHSLSELIEFFSNVSLKLKEDGVFIFDCWNGTACRIEKPIEKTQKEIIHDWYRISIKNQTETNLLKSTSKMLTSVLVFSENEKVDEFSYDITHKLWTPDILQSICEMNGIEVYKIIKNYNEKILAKDTDHRVTFICKKHNKIDESTSESSNFIYESPDNGKTIYARKIGNSPYNRVKLKKIFNHYKKNKN